MSRQVLATGIVSRSKALPALPVARQPRVLWHNGLILGIPIWGLLGAIIVLV